MCKILIHIYDLHLPSYMLKNAFFYEASAYVQLHDSVLRYLWQHNAVNSKFNPLQPQLNQNNYSSVTNSHRYNTLETKSLSERIFDWMIMDEDKYQRDKYAFENINRTYYKQYMFAPKMIHLRKGDMSLRDFFCKVFDMYLHKFGILCTAIPLIRYRLYSDRRDEIVIDNDGKYIDSKVLFMTYESYPNMVGCKSKYQWEIMRLLEEDDKEYRRNIGEEIGSENIWMETISSPEESQMKLRGLCKEAVNEYTGNTGNFTTKRWSNLEVARRERKGVLQKTHSEFSECSYEPKRKAWTINQETSRDTSDISKHDEREMKRSLKGKVHKASIISLKTQGGPCESNGETWGGFSGNPEEGRDIAEGIPVEPPGESTGNSDEGRSEHKGITEEEIFNKKQLQIMSVPNSTLFIIAFIIILLCIVSYYFRYGL